MKYEIIREDSKYGNMKWHLVGKSVHGNTSAWFKTEAEAKHEIEQNKKRESEYESRMTYERTSQDYRKSLYNIAQS